MRRERYLEAHRIKVLRAQAAARKEAKALSIYLAELEAVHGDNPASVEWVA